MKNLHNYLTEKLKLSDINKDNLDGKWKEIKSSNIKYKDITVGSCIELELPNGNMAKYILVSYKIAQELFKDDTFDDGPYLVRKNIGTKSGYSYYPFNDFDRELLLDCATYIRRVKLRKKDYRNTKELKKDLDILYYDEFI